MFDYDESFVVDKLNDREEDVPMDCPNCDGQGRLIDFWGPMRCATCDGTGMMFLSVWKAYVKTFPEHIQEHMLRNEPRRWRKLNGR
ncbi:MAG: hypothetical protein KC910_38730 [Candidatus Eremiobacteraeota bacterium]|nr:hypothetical protein [Candidatus Eremiobacteraeota bacterium]